MTPKKLALPAALALLLLAAAYGARPAAPALSLGWYSGGACDDAEAQNPGDPQGCRYDASERDCGDGVDNDSDERTDGADPDCGHGDPVCGNELAYNAGQVGDCAPGAEPAHCADGLDNDGDGYYDCSDMDCDGSPNCRACAAVVEVCDNGQDDDCDGLVDGDDQDCGCTTDWYNWWQPKCGCPATERDADGDCAADESWWGSACADGNDNDGDGAYDCQDGDCAGDPACAGACNSDAPENCTDGQDDDCDGLTDCADGDCAYYCATYGNPGDPGSGDPGNGDRPNDQGRWDPKAGWPSETYGGPYEGYCNDGVCERQWESYFNCPADCRASFCGNDECEILDGETRLNCIEDCDACGDGDCSSVGGENTENCPQDCYASDCGNGICEVGETLDTCSLDCSSCGNFACEWSHGETTENCPKDCAEFCGDYECDAHRGETIENCPGDCRYYCGDGYCHSQIGEDPDTCAPDCYVPQMRDPEGNPA